MQSTGERIGIMSEVKNLVDEWHGYIKSFGNECAYTDSIIEEIQKLVKKL